MDVSWLQVIGMLALPGLFAAIILGITWQNWRTRHWQATIGRIVESRSASRDVHSRESRLVDTGNGGGSGHVVTTEKIDRKNFVDIAYEYAVAGKTFSSRRVRIGADRGNLDVVELLRRYSKGKPVTVFYDPASPGDSILERDDPRRLRAAWLGVAILAAVIVAGFFAFDRVLAFVEADAGNRRRTPLIMFALVSALFAALLACGAVQRARRMRRWPTADGVVVESRVETTTMRRSRSYSRSKSVPVFVPRVIYRYRVEGIAIDGDQLGRTASGTSPKVAEGIIAPFPVGTRLVVRYDPNDPTTAIVDPAAGWLPWALVAVAAALIAVAYAIAFL